MSPAPLQPTDQTSLRAFIDWLARRLKPHTETPRLDAQVLLGHILGKPRSWLLAHPEADISPQQKKALSRTLSRLEAGVPLPYILGHWEFYGLDFNLDPAVLIPRPETELLIEQALDWLRAHPDRRRAADIGTGSGCITVTLAKLIPDLHVTATDISPKALQIARSNAEKHHVAERISLFKSDLLPNEKTNPGFDLICANLPYIPTETLHTLKVYGREPILALDGGSDGLDLIRSLLEQAPRRLTRGGLLLIEIDSSHGDRAISLAREAFPNADVRLLPDLAGHDRLIRIERENQP
jgi:release factor glutamine methyltransferase